MSKRVFSLVLACCLVCGCMIVPAQASEAGVTQQLLNVLEFDTVNGSGDFYTTSVNGKATASFQLPYGTLMRYIDMYISTPNKVISAVNWEINGVEFPLTVEPVYGATYYRIYGQVSGGYTDTVKLNFTWEEAGAFKLQFYSLHVSAQAYSVYSAPSTLTVTGHESSTDTQETGTSTIILIQESGVLSESISDYHIELVNTHWAKYDRMNFRMIVDAVTIDSINCTIGNQQIPAEISYLETTPADLNVFLDDESRWGVNRLYFDVNITVDLTGFNRTVDDPLYIDISGTSDRVTGALYDSRGYVIADLPEAEVTWLQKIWNTLTDGFQSVVDAITGDVGSADDFQDAVDDKSEELETMAGIMDSIDTPDDFDPDSVINVDVTDGLSGLGSGLSYIILSPYIFPLLVMSLSLAFVGYALFGKRG